MNLKIISWESKGLRSPDMCVKLDVNGLKKITLVQMPNGTGKTTTLEMIQAAMTGEARWWSSEKVMDYRPTNASFDSATFKLELLIDKSPLTFELILDFDTKKVFYKTISPEIGGIVDDWSPPTHVRRFLNKSFVGLFIFDGELAERLLKSDTQHAEAENAIDALCQLYLFDDCNKKLDEFWNDATRATGPTTGQGLSIWRRKEVDLKNRKDELFKLKDGLEKKSILLKKEIEELTGSITERLASEGGRKNEWVKAKDEESTLISNVDTVGSEFMEIMRKPYLLNSCFSDALINLKDKMDKHQLPRKTSSQFFMELIEDPECICGRPMNAEAKSTILKNSNKYLGEDITGTLNALKDDIVKYVTNADKNLFTLKKEELKGEVNKAFLATTSRQILENQFLESGGKALQDDQIKLTKLEAKDFEIDESLEDINEPDDGDDNLDSLSLASITRQYNKAKNKANEISDTVNLHKQVEIIQDVLNSAKKISRDLIRDELTIECNEKIQQVLKRNPVRISRIGRSLELEGQRGASAGQTLAIGYTFLASLLHKGQNEFPLVVDSPAGPIDPTVRKEVAEMIPDLCDQFLAFTTASEKLKFVKPLARACNNDITYLTLFRKTDGSKDLMQDLPKQGVIETDSGVLVSGKEYFELFDSEDE
ncbi:MAG TPA: hypothetical protein EYQ06_01975 [Flavobacteriales bacterium]|jgi:DNA sulfur modification protein DndD|nr:hypothetical protein [Flavobacteriales bacterium]